MSKARIRGDIYRYYNEGFKERARQMVLDIGECQSCGKDYKGVLTVAHVDQNHKNDSPENLKVLCQSCHIRLDHPFVIFSMSTKKKQTDNSFFEEKVSLRIDSLAEIQKKEINVLEAFAGDGYIWKEVQRRTNKKVNILKIDVKDGKKGVYLKGDNMKFLPLFDFSEFDIIDLDAYGSPYNQLKVVFLKEFKGIVHCTFIQSGNGQLHKGMLFELGYTENMISKIKSVFNSNGLQKMKDYLSLHGIRQIHGYFLDRKNYFWFKLA